MVGGGEKNEEKTSIFQFAEKFICIGFMLDACYIKMVYMLSVFSSSSSLFFLLLLLLFTPYFPIVVVVARSTVFSAELEHLKRQQQSWKKFLPCSLMLIQQWKRRRKEDAERTQK